SVLSSKRRQQSRTFGLSKSKRNFGDQILPIIRSVICPNHNQRFDHFADWGVLRDDEKHPRARPARRHKRGKSFRRRPLIVAYENSGLCRRETQNGIVIEAIQSARLKVEARFAAQSRVDDDPLQVVVRLKTDAQGFVRSCVKISWRARLRRAYSSGRLSLKGGTERLIAASPSRTLESTSCSLAREKAIAPYTCSRVSEEKLWRRVS